MRGCPDRSRGLTAPGRPARLPTETDRCGNAVRPPRGARPHRRATGWARPTPGSRRRRSSRHSSAPTTAGWDAPPPRPPPPRDVSPKRPRGDVPPPKNASAPRNVSPRPSGDVCGRFAGDELGRPPGDVPSFVPIHHPPSEEGGSGSRARGHSARCRPNTQPNEPPRGTSPYRERPPSPPPKRATGPRARDPLPPSRRSPHPKPPSRLHPRGKREGTRRNPYPPGTSNPHPP